MKCECLSVICVCFCVCVCDMGVPVNPIFLWHVKHRFFPLEGLFPLSPSGVTDNADEGEPPSNGEPLWRSSVALGIAIAFCSGTGSKIRFNLKL